MVSAYSLLVWTAGGIVSKANSAPLSCANMLRIVASYVCARLIGSDQKSLIVVDTLFHCGANSVGAEGEGRARIDPRARAPISTSRIYFI